MGSFRILLKSKRQMVTSIHRSVDLPGLLIIHSNGFIFTKVFLLLSGNPLSVCIKLFKFADNS